MMSSLRSLRRAQCSVSPPHSNEEKFAENATARWPKAIVTGGSVRVIDSKRVRTKAQEHLHRVFMPALCSPV